MSAAFTPGPWRLEPHAKLGGTQMYWVNDFTSVGTQVDGDANLIAAAPDLYEAAEHMLVADESESGTHYAAAIAKLHDALRKARGEQSL